MANRTTPTQREFFNGLIAFVKGEETSFTSEDFVTFLNGRIEALDKKSANKKPTKTQEANEVIKATILEVLGEAEGGLTVTEVLGTGRLAEGTSNQKVSALLRQLVESGKVVKTTDKKVSRFALA